MEVLLARLGNPELATPTIHVAGSKGKGSTSAMIASVLTAAGLRTGLFTSPHLHRMTERIRIDMEEISPDRFSYLVEKLWPDVEAVEQRGDVGKVSVFEMLTAMAFYEFREVEADVQVIEVGLGGRLDATNVLSPLVSVITSLSLDHTILLGDTLPEIAAEKGGIIKPGTPVVTAPQVPEALERLLEIADSEGAPVTIVGRDWQWQAVPHLQEGIMSKPPSRQQIILSQATDTAFVRPPLHLTLNLTGRHQQENAMVALATVDKAAGAYPRLDVNAVVEGLARVDWPGRLQVLSSDDDRPTLLVDCAHNADSAAKLAFALKHDYRFETLWLILGITADKDQRGILQELLPLAERVIMTSSGHPRAAKPAELVELAGELGTLAVASSSVTEAVRRAWREARPKDLICVSGSIFVVGDLLYHWDGLQSEL